MVHILGVVDSWMGSFAIYKFDGSVAGFTYILLSRDGYTGVIYIDIALLCSLGMLCSQ